MDDGIVDRLAGELEQLSGELRSGLETIHERGIPEETRWVVLWIGLGGRYDLLLVTYVGCNGGPVRRADVQGELVDVRAALEALERRLALGEVGRELRLDCDDVFFEWLRRVARGTSWWTADVGLAMGVNNAVVCFDLRSGDEVFLD